MSDELDNQTPTSGPGWYPDPQLVDTVRYWDGSAWTDHRAPTSTRATFAEAPTPPPTPPPAAASTASPAVTAAEAPTKRRRWLPWAIVAAIALVVAAGGLSIKNSMDANVQRGRELADAMTTDQGEQEALESFFSSAAPSPASDGAASLSDLGACDTPVDDGGAQGLWIAVTNTDWTTKGDQFSLAPLCTVYEWDQKNKTRGDSGAWGQDSAGVHILRGCGDVVWCESRLQSAPDAVYDFELSADGNTLTRVDYKGGSGGKMVLERAPEGTANKAM